MKRTILTALVLAALLVLTQWNGVARAGSAAGIDADGRLRGAAPALLGLARGDDTIPGIGDRKLSDIPPRRLSENGWF